MYRSPVSCGVKDHTITHVKEREWENRIEIVEKKGSQARNP